MSYTAYIGIDDTDIIGSPGTGNISKRLAKYLESLGLGTSTGITRNQLLVDSRIRYTSHNSSLCIALETDSPLDDLKQPCIDFLASIFVEGSDPGLCIVTREQINDEITEFGFSAQKTVLHMQQARDIAAKHNLFLVELGGTGEGIVGALAAVALRVEGNSGRFIELEGIRSVNGLVSAGELLDRTGIDSVIDIQGNLLDNEDMIDSMDWVRPSLFGGKPVFRASPGTDGSGNIIWFSEEAKKRRERKEAKAKNEHC